MQRLIRVLVQRLLNASLSTCTAPSECFNGGMFGGGVRLGEILT